ncbi:5-oxoprolinase subunit B family protein [Palleronia caenipelagi]|uniref:Allophanate hydrolase subunit 1 n=1 Tax=Palleronia caenipelagi TaxID=2489174 RepID=A0A547QAX0_9RHOB|nr:allophanate hydrolase subunit 1 [Palleronia caenipelagi]TRD23529.1 allophanate hydrolase subunit 1 [Palleronia caenipelagi]
MTEKSNLQPQLRRVGVDGLLVTFGDRLSEAANRAALAFRAAIESADLPGCEETSTSLTSTYLRFDPLACPHARIEADLQALIASQDWYAAPLPRGRRLWYIPTVFGTDLAPQLDEAAAMAGMSPEEAIRSISETRVRVQTIGFAAGQPYLGELPAEWDIPRQTSLTAKVPVGALTVAIRQLVLFAVSTPTGWRHIGQTAFRAFRPESNTPFVLSPGDEVLFEQISPETYHAMPAGEDGARWEKLS